MIPAPFEYARPDSVDAAVRILADNVDEAKVLAGGHSLLPLMKLRLASPTLLVDVGRLSELSYVRAEPDHVAIGALTRHRDLETSPILRESVPVLASAASLIGDPQVRHRGTIGGSLAHGDAASDLPAVVLALGASVVVRGPSNERVVPATELFKGFLQTALGPDELLVEIRVPYVTGPSGYVKFTRRAQDWAIVAVAVASTREGVGVGLVNMGSVPLRATQVERAIAEGADAAEASERAAEGTNPPSDLAGSSEYRRHLARVLTLRALREAGY